MAIIVQTQPERYSLAYNDNPFVFRSTSYTPTNGQRFSVSVVDTSLNLIAQELVYPRQGTLSSSSNLIRAYYDPSRVLQSLVSDTVQIPTGGNVAYSANEMFFDYVITIQEQVKNASGVYENTDLWFSDVKTVWNGGVNKIDWLDFDYTDYDYSIAPPRLFLTNAPTTQYIESDQSAFLYMLNTIDSNFTLRVQSFDASGSVLQTSQKTFSNNTFNQICVGTYDLDNSDPTGWSTDPTTLTTGASYYIVSVDGASNQIIRYNINQRCTKYDTIRLHWLNRLGGIDSHNFNYKSMEETDIDRKSYLQQEHQLSGNRWFYSKDSRGVTDYHVGTQKKLTVNTNFLTESESIWMEDFATSPVIYQEVNNELIAMSGRPKNIGKQTSLNDKLMQYTFELDYSLNDMRQRG